MNVEDNLDVAELDELPKVALHRAQESTVRRSSAFCCRLIKRLNNRLTRYRRSTRYLKILEASQAVHAPGEPMPTGPPWPRPLCSPAPCFNCHRYFKGPPVFMPMRMLDGVAEEDLNFCCGPCARTYLHTNMRDAFLAVRDADLLEYMQRYHGFRGTSLGFAPHFTQLQRYLGDLTDEQFDEICQKPELTTSILRRPFIPTEVVVEWQCVGDGGALDMACSAAGDDAADARAGVGAVGPPTKAAQPGEAAVKVLTEVMQAPAPPTDQHQRWDVSFLQQKPHEEILKRCASLPELPRGESLYASFLAELDRQRDAGQAAPGADPSATGGPAPETAAAAAAAADVVTSATDVVDVLPAAASTAVPAAARKRVRAPKGTEAAVAAALPAAAVPAAKPAAKRSHKKKVRTDQGGVEATTQHGR
jgi:hypothetical protein